MKKIIFIGFIFIVIFSTMLWKLNTYASISSYLTYNSDTIKNLRITNGATGEHIDISSEDEINKFINQINKIEVKKKFSYSKYVGWLYNLTITDIEDNSTEVTLEEFIKINHNYYIESPDTTKHYNSLLKMCDMAFGK